MKGFIINHELNRIFTEKNDPIESMLFYGILENGESFIWEQTYPYILAFLNTPLPEEYQDRVWKKIENAFTDYRKNPLWGYFFKNQSSLSEVKESHPDLGYHESDVLAGEQFLMSRHIRGSVNFLSEPERTEGGVVYFTDPKVEAVKELFVPSVKVWSLDIETGVESDQIYAIGVYGDGIKRVLLQDPGVTDGSSQKEIKSLQWGEIKSYPDEVGLLKGFQELIEAEGPHVFIGWNVMGFDFNFLLRKFNQHQLQPLWGVNQSPVISFKSEKGRPATIVKIPGRAIVEGMDLVRSLFAPLPNYKLNTAAEYILKEKKTIEKQGKDKIEEIERLYREDKDELARYNLQDARLVYDIFHTLKGIDFIFNASTLSGVIPEKIFNPHEVIDHYYIPLLHKNKVAAYQRFSTQTQISAPSSVKNFPGGFYSKVVVVELKDIFPSVMIAHRIDPLGMIRAHIDKEHSSVIPNGVFFHDQDHILPGILRHLLKLRSEANDNSLTVLTAAIENAIQQISTGLGSTYSRFFLPGLFNVIEANVRLVVEALANRLGTIGSQGGSVVGQVIYYDNACLVVALREDVFEDFSNYLSEWFSRDFLFNLLPGLDTKDHCLFGIKHSLYFKEFFMPRQDAGTKNKSSLRYWALDSNEIFVKQNSEKPSFDLVAKICDQAIYRLLHKQDVESHLREFKKSVFAGELDSDLVYRKKLTKKPSEYSTEQMPPQAVAALKALDQFEGPNFFDRNVAYCQTVKGPEPIQALHSKLDHKHYWDREFIPALEKILIHCDREDLIHLLQNQDHQLSLF